MTTDEILIPQIWDTLKSEGLDAGMSGLFNIWENRLRKTETKEDSRPRTILCVTFGKMVNLIPQDAPHPLYSPDYRDQTDSFILDHLCMEEISCEDEKLNDVEGVVLETMSGKKAVFKKNETTQKITVNDIEVEESKSLSDGTQIFILSNFLFRHFEDTQESFKKISDEITNEFCPLKQSTN